MNITIEHARLIKETSGAETVRVTDHGDSVVVVALVNGAWVTWKCMYADYPHHTPESLRQLCVEIGTKLGK